MTGNGKRKIRSLLLLKDSVLTISVSPSSTTHRFLPAIGMRSREEK
jgi:hypothetical protein